MKYEEFIGKVRRRARMETSEEAERAIMATLTVLSDRLGSNEASDLASQLPPEMASLLQWTEDKGSRGFSLDEFFHRVSERENVPLVDAEYHARVVIALLAESITMGEVEDIKAQLPADFARLFDVENAGDIPELGSIEDVDAEEEEAFE